ncbi:hypothetical protein [Aromatoleum buckelii]|uniref:Uncharacterized protein n=1 Tax=Aromatoleum buckelii TaxID=200254 RepID=A0ABX1N3P1_9RHOO|nr:hypothetical protein [Aromatoleum buckelii]MCK0509841.1 hypothetical protein [Aromatoleum buckelii]
MNVVHINTHPSRLRPGELAIHREHGWVEILERTGPLLRIRWIDCSPVAHEDLAPDEIDGEVLTAWEDWVGCESLRPMPRPSLGGKSAARTPLDLAARRTPPAGQGPETSAKSLHHENQRG